MYFTGSSHDINKMCKSIFLGWMLSVQGALWESKSTIFKEEGIYVRDEKHANIPFLEEILLKAKSLFRGVQY